MGDPAPVDDVTSQPYFFTNKMTPFKNIDQHKQLRAHTICTSNSHHPQFFVRHLFSCKKNWPIAQPARKSKQMFAAKKMPNRKPARNSNVAATNQVFATKKIWPQSKRKPAHAFPSTLTLSLSFPLPSRITPMPYTYIYAQQYTWYRITGLAPWHKYNHGTHYTYSKD